MVAPDDWLLLLRGALVDRRVFGRCLRHADATPHLVVILSNERNLSLLSFTKSTFFCRGRAGHSKQSGNK